MRRDNVGQSLVVVPKSVSRLDAHKGCTYEQ